MIDIIVQRGLGDKPGPDISDPLLSTVPAAIARGTYEIDSAISVYIVSQRSGFRVGVKLGELVEIHDALQGISWRGRIVGITHASRGATLWTDIDIERVV